MSRLREYSHVRRYKNFVPKLKGRYLPSNVNITVLDEHGNVVSVPVGSMSCFSTLPVQFGMADNFNHRRPFR